MKLRIEILFPQRPSNSMCRAKYPTHPYEIQRHAFSTLTQHTGRMTWHSPVSRVKSRQPGTEISNIENIVY